MEFFCLFCDAAEEDLTEFFEHWGWLEPFESVIGDYSSQKHNLTQNMVNEAKNKVRSKNYPKAGALQYIEDRDKVDKEDQSIAETLGDTGYWIHYRDNIKVPKTIQGKKSEISDENGHYVRIEAYNIGGTAGFEIWQNNVITYKTVKKCFDVPRHIYQSGCLFAVQTDGLRIKFEIK